MLTPEQLANCADDIVELYAKLDEEIIRDVVRRFCQTGIITETGKLQLNALQNVGMLHSDIMRSFSEYSGISQEMTRKLFEQAAVTSLEYDMAIYLENGLEPVPLHMSPAAMQVLEAGYIKTEGNLQNLTMTTAKTSQTNFISACTLAEMKVESGAFSYNQAILDAIKLLAVEGSSVSYPSGHTDKLDVAVRRNVMTGLGQTTGQICLGYAQELGCDLMEITAHSGARPSHAAWQGQIVSLSGKKGYLTLTDIGYGTGEGFKGWNCRHDWYPYFEGSTRMYSVEDLEALNAKDVEYPDGSMHTQYEAEQRQRAYERKIRQYKRELAADDEAIKILKDEVAIKTAKDDFDKVSVKLKSVEAELQAFCKKTDLLPANARTQVYGFGRSTAQRAVWSNKKNIAKSHKKSIIKLQLNLFDKSDALWVEAFSMEEDEGFENVCMHGSPDSVQMIVDGKPKNYSAFEFAQFLRDSKKYNGGNIKLLSCSTGKGNNSFAQQLSKELGIIVKAPDDDVYYAVEEGVAFVGASYTNTGKWRLFQNGVEIYE